MKLMKNGIVWYLLMTFKEWSIAALSVLYKAGLAVQKDDHFIPDS